jgi:hypothetical protein
MAKAARRTSPHSQLGANVRVRRGSRAERVCRAPLERVLLLSFADLARAVPEGAAPRWRPFARARSPSARRYTRSGLSPRDRCRTGR